MVELIDVAGTIYDYSNIEPSYWHFGKSIKNFIDQKVDNHREEVFTEGGRLRLERQASEEQSLQASAWALLSSRKSSSKRR